MRILVNLAPKEVPSGKVREPLVEMPKARSATQVERRPNRFWKDRENVLAEIRKMVARSGKEPREMGVKDFRENGLSTVICENYNGSPFLALFDAGLVSEADEAHMRKRGPRSGTIDGKYNTREKRISVILRFAQELGKEPRDILQKDFGNHGLRGLLVKYYNGSPYLALLDAGLVTEADEKYMRLGGSAKVKYRREMENGKPGTDLPSSPSEGLEN